MLTEQDIPHFFATPSDLDLEDYVQFTYTFETAIDPRLAAATLCCEQSTAQWQRPGVDEDFRVAHGAKVLSLTEQGRQRYQINVAHPHRNFGPRLPNLLSAAAGEGPFYCPGITTIKWTDFQLPESYRRHFSGPQFGLAGVREQLGVEKRPFFIGVVKPNIGLPPQEFAEIARQAWLGGLDMAKDDEMLADTEWSAVVERTRLSCQARRDAEQRTERRKFFIANITDEIERISELHDAVVEEGADSVMINTIFTGISALRSLRRISRVPVTSHFTGTSVLSRMANFGISSRVMTKLQRLAGADIIILAGFGERMACSDEEVLENVQACLEPWGSLKSSLPVPGGSDSASTLPLVYEKIGHVDFGFICGRGVFGHPDGPRAGAQSLHEAWSKISRKT